MLKKLRGYVNPFALLRQQPVSQPLCAFSCGAGRYFVIAQRFAALPFDAVQHQLVRVEPEARALPFTRGLVGLLSYDQFAERASGKKSAERASGKKSAELASGKESAELASGKKSAELASGKESAELASGKESAELASGKESAELASGKKSAKLASPVLARFFRVETALIFDLHTATVWQSGEGGEVLPALPAVVPPPSRRLCLRALDSEADYLATVRRIMADIRDGRYYLLNFLRFWQVSPCDHDDLLCRLAHSNAPCRAVLRQEDLALFSFSPEQFVTLRHQQGGTQLTCTPLKGTAARHADGRVDQRARQALQSSAKDLAELHITIDLARNDINRIAQVGSTQVSCAAQVRSFATVHHLVGTITARLRDDVTLGEFLQALCPTASISGAPKVEVMRAIATYEARARGFFMGNIISIDESGRLDSSVLIRTLIEDAQGAVYAAGGGIVLDSDPQRERQEIETKLQTLLCRS